MSRVTIPKLKQMKINNEKIIMLTAYDFPTASLLDEAGIEMILVGDSLGMVVLGYENTLPVTMAEMLHHTKAVRRGAKEAIVIGDMPFMSFNLGPRQAIKNAGRFIKEGGAAAVKLEGCTELMIEIIKAVVDAGISVMGHIGLTPQFIHQMGGFRIQGKETDTAEMIFNGAKKLEDAGVFAIVIEGVPSGLASKITNSITVPTIGIGAGSECDGQVIVTHDLLGLTNKKPPKFVKQYLQLYGTMKEALSSFKDDVRSGRFPTEDFCY